MKARWIILAVLLVIPLQASGAGIVLRSVTTNAEYHPGDVLELVLTVDAASAVNRVDLVLEGPGGVIRQDQAPVEFVLVAENSYRGMYQYQPDPPLKPGEYRWSRIRVARTGQEDAALGDPVSGPHLKLSRTNNEYSGYYQAVAFTIVPPDVPLTSGEAVSNTDSEPLEPDAPLPGQGDEGLIIPSPGANTTFPGMVPGSSDLPCGEASCDRTNKGVADINSSEPGESIGSPGNIDTITTPGSHTGNLSEDESRTDSPVPDEHSPNTTSDLPAGSAGMQPDGTGNTTSQGEGTIPNLVSPQEGLANLTNSSGFSQNATYSGLLANLTGGDMFMHPQLLLNISDIGYRQRGNTTRLAEMRERVIEAFDWLPGTDVPDKAAPP